MLFASLDFLLFIVPVLGLYWLLAGHPRVRALLLIGASYFFYMASSRPAGGGLPTPWYYAGLLIFSTVLNYVCTARIHAHNPGLGSADPNEVSRARGARKAWLLLALGGNLGLLAYFKYTNFCIEAFTDIANALGAEMVATYLPIALPIGISFYTFQSLSYTIDVWRQTLTREPSFRKYALFVAFFPQLVMGPIVRASEFLPQLHRRPQLDRVAVGEALFRIGKGMFKKVVFGDWIPVVFSDMVFASPDNYTSAEHLLALYAFTLQIYGDFSGYSDIAIGIARLLGFKLPENFDRPYQARHVGEFWRRWHMTLSTWLRDYLFFPLGGSRKGPGRTYFNLWLTMFLVGMWHRASWNFIIYSNVHGLAMLFNRWTRLRYASGRKAGLGVGLAILGFAALVYSLARAVLAFDPAEATTLTVFAAVTTTCLVLLPDRKSPGWIAVHVAFTFHFTVLSRIFFLADDLDAARTITRKLVDWDSLGVRPGLFRVEAWRDFGTEFLAGILPSPLVATFLWFAEHGIVLVMIAGLAYHFTPRHWVDTLLRDRFARLPGPVIGLILVLIGAILVDLLDGPRANIYFVF